MKAKRGPTIFFFFFFLKGFYVTLLPHKASQSSLVQADHQLHLSAISDYRFIHLYVPNATYSPCVYGLIKSLIIKIIVYSAIRVCN